MIIIIIILLLLLLLSILNYHYYYVNNLWFIVDIVLNFVMQRSIAFKKWEEDHLAGTAG